MKNGIIAIDKPGGISSARVVARVKKTLRVKKVGHTGTLDPFATGLMLCGVNKGTRISRFLLGGDKVYQAVIYLGMETDTFDITGIVRQTWDSAIVNDISFSDITNVLSRFTGPQKQLPPVYSALKHNGKPLYQLAREGRPVQKPPRDITIFSLSLTDVSLPTISMEVHCSSGTYIRTLANDIGRALGCGATLSSLRRIRSSNFSVKDALPLDVLERMNTEEAFARLVPMADALGGMPSLSADSQLIKKIACGVQLSGSDFFLNSEDVPKNNIRIIDSQGDLAAIAAYDKDKDKFKYCCVFIS